VLEVPIVRLDPDLAVPAYAREGDAGADLVAREDQELAPAGGRARVSTGVSVAIPAGYAGFVLPRSGLALRHGVTCLNSPGLIDAGYRPFLVQRGERIAQLVIMRVEHARFAAVDEHDETHRGEGGWGHTG